MSEILELEDITKTFGGIIALDGFEGSVAADDITGLIGPNGAGKTTLFNVITGALDPDSGTVRFQGEDVTRERAHKICRKGIARTFQTPKPIRSLTVEKNLRVAHRFGGSDSTLDEEELYQRTLEFFDLGKKQNVRTENLQLIEQKQVDVARALMSAPTLLLLDEIMAGLTPTEKIDMCETIKQLNSEFDIAVLLIEHDLKRMRSISDTIIAMNNGRHLLTGSPTEVLEDDGLQEAYIGK
ncbi:ABC transporter ATP-binding protein [Natrinema sp. 1APR25-10V2]|uniref:ABC transporter ATP-binding protein n=1 Tax=Natrinema sp. 1APR25-10V2 TaxID=2951081 RepID=UPI002875E599|nr:ABC transporter ATP-binding protein [Natrinema sp. 1APR25-10V2]MDS0477310.1 ABC transporter ATP-binding protein [Natrinema sp. 1APR25-10V2]